MITTFARAAARRLAPLASVSSVAAVAAAAAAVLGGAGPLASVARAAVPDASADEGGDAFARVIVDGADLRTGPGVSYRVLVTAHRGETFALDGRPGPGFWLRVMLPDGRSAYVLGDEVQAFAVKADDPGDHDGAGVLRRPGLLAPPPLAGAHAGLAIVAGTFVSSGADGSRQAFGFMEARPSVVVHKSVTLEGFVGDALTADGSQILYGGAVQIQLAPSWPVCPFVGLGGGGLSVFPSSGSFVLKREDLYVARASAGLLFALRGRILVRVEASNMTLFTSDSSRSAQTYAGGLGVYF